MEATLNRLTEVGLPVERDASHRGYQGRIVAAPEIQIAFLSATEIAAQLKSGKIDAGITGEDVLRESIPPTDDSVEIIRRFDFGQANVIVAVPECWLDVTAMSDLDEVAEQFYANHNRRLRVATKYKNLTRRFFGAHGISGYRIVESAGATEGAPAAGTADVIVDITTTGSTLAANQLKILDDGLILESTAILALRGRATDEKYRSLVRFPV